MTYNTGNPIGSNDARDLSDNAANFDELVNSTTKTEQPDRRGVIRKTWKGLMDLVDAFLLNAGYEEIGDYAAGLVVSARNQIFVRDGEYYRAAASTALPYAATGTWADESSKFISMGDHFLRGDLASSADGKGAELVHADDGASGSLWTTVAGFVSKIISSAGASVIGYISNATGAVATTLQNLFDRQSVFVANFLTADEYADGQTGAPIIDIAPKLVLAEAAARASGKRLVGCGGKYLCGSTVAINCSGDLSEMTLVADGASITPIVRVGKTTGGHTFNIDLKLPKISNSAHAAGDGWATYSGNVGVSLDNLYDSKVYIQSVTGFGVGVYAGGNADAGLGACEINIGYVADNKVNLRIGPKATTGWSNANTYSILRCRHNGAETNGGVAFSGTRNILIENCNDNVLIKPTIEGTTASTEFTLELRNANHNTIVQPRWENSAAGGSSTMPVKLYADAGKGTQGNLILGGYEFGAGLSYTFEGAGVISNNTKLGAGRGDQSFSVQNPIAVQNTVGDNVAQAHFQGFSATAQILGKSASATDYTYRFYANGIDGKRSTDENARVRINWSTAGILLGAGTTNALTYGVFAFSTIGLATNSDWMPQATATYNLGIASYRWNNCYLVNAPNVSSDARAKQQISGLSDAERAVAIKCKGLIRKYKLNASVEEKGAGARWHFGAIAQDIKSAFESEGLDAFDYSLLCYDEWGEHQEKTDEDGNVVTPFRAAGGMYSLRYEELLAFIISAL